MTTGSRVWPVPSSPSTGVGAPTPQEALRMVPGQQRAPGPDYEDGWGRGTGRDLQRQGPIRACWPR